MATLADFQEAFAEINIATDNLAADIERLTAAIGSNMSAEDEEAALSELNAIAARLRDIAAITPEPDEPEE